MRAWANLHRSTHRSAKPGLGSQPVALDSARGDSERFRRLFFGIPRKIAAFDDLQQSGLFGLEAFKHLVDGEDLFQTEQITKERIANAIADYERTPAAGGVPWDQTAIVDVRARRGVMFGFATVITVVVMAASLLVLAALYRRFRRQAVEPLHAALAAAAFVLGLIAIPGLLHTIAVVGSAVNNHKPYDLRLVFLLTLGLIFIYTGSVNMLLSSRIKRSERGALVMSASTTALLVGFLAVLYPAKSETLLIVVNGTYLGLLLVGLRRPGKASIPPVGLA